jgi:hypothetical protein
MMLRKLVLPLLGAAVLIAVVVLLTGWWHNEFSLPQNANCEVLEGLVVSEAAFKAASDVKRGDPHLIGIHGYTVELPGAPEDHGDLLPSNYRVTILPCTSDGLVSRRHKTLNEKARKYAAAYNRATLLRTGAAGIQHAP